MRERGSISLLIINFSFPLQNPQIQETVSIFSSLCLPRCKPGHTNSGKLQFLPRKCFIVQNSSLNIDFPDCFIPTLLRKIPVLKNLLTYCLSKLRLCQDMIYFQSSLLRVYRCSATSIRETNYLFNLSGF